MKKKVSKKELMERIDYMLKNMEYDKVLYFYWLMGVELGIFKSKSKE